jgi:hypothetical protein
MQTAHYDVVTGRAFHASGSLGAPHCPGTGSNELKNWGGAEEDCRTVALLLVQELGLCVRAYLGVSVGSGEGKGLRGPLQREPSGPRTKHLPTYLPTLVEVGNCLIKTRQQNMSHTTYTATRDIGTRNPPQAPGIAQSHQQNDKRSAACCPELCVPLSVDACSITPIAFRTVLCTVKTPTFRNLSPYVHQGHQTADQCHYIERIHPRTQTHRADYSHLAHGTAWAEAS